MISGAVLIGVIIWIIIFGLIFGLLWWLINYVALPEPFAKIARVVLAVAAVILLINLLLQLGGMTPIIRF